MCCGCWVYAMKKVKIKDMHKKIDCAGVVKVIGCGHTYFESL